MSASLTLQYMIIAVAVLVSAWVVMKKQFPGAVRRLRVAMALPLLRERRSGRLQRLGRWLAPAPRLSGEPGCNGCSSCEPASTKSSSKSSPR